MALWRLNVCLNITQIRITKGKNVKLPIFGVGRFIPTIRDGLSMFVYCFFIWIPCPAQPLCLMVYHLSLTLLLCVFLPLFSVYFLFAIYVAFSPIDLLVGNYIFLFLDYGTEYIITATTVTKSYKEKENLFPSQGVCTACYDIIRLSNSTRSDQ